MRDDDEDSDLSAEEASNGDLSGRQSGLLDSTSHSHCAHAIQGTSHSSDHSSNVDPKSDGCIQLQAQGGGDVHQGVEDLCDLPTGHPDGILGTSSSTDNEGASSGPRSTEYYTSFESFSADYVEDEPLESTSIPWRRHFHEDQIAQLLAENALLKSQWGAALERWATAQEAQGGQRSYVCTVPLPDDQAKLDLQYEELSRQLKEEKALNAVLMKKTKLKQQKKLQKKLKMQDRKLRLLESQNRELQHQVQRNFKVLQRAEGLPQAVFRQHGSHQQDVQILLGLLRHTEEGQRRAQVAAHRLSRELNELQQQDPFPHLSCFTIKDIVEKEEELQVTEQQLEDTKLKIVALEQWLDQLHRNSVSRRRAISRQFVSQTKFEEASTEASLEHEAGVLQSSIAGLTSWLQRMDEMMDPDASGSKRPCRPPSPPVPSLRLFSGRLKSQPLAIHCSPKVEGLGSRLSLMLSQQTRPPTVITAQKRDLLRYSGPNTSHTSVRDPSTTPKAHCPCQPSIPRPSHPCHRTAQYDTTARRSPRRPLQVPSK